MKRKEFDAKMAELDSKVVSLTTAIGRVSKPEEVRDSEKIATYIGNVQELLAELKNVQVEAARLVADQFGLPLPETEAQTPVPEEPFKELPEEADADFSKEEYEALRKTVFSSSNNEDPHSTGPSAEFQAQIPTATAVPTFQPDELPKGLQFLDDAWSLFKRGYKLFYNRK